MSCPNKPLTSQPDRLEKARGKEYWRSLEELAGTAVRIERGPARSGDARHTGADTTVAREAFGYAPATGLREGLSAMIVANGARPAASPPA